MTLQTDVVFGGLIELAGERVGGRALAASDEFFAARANLLRAGAATFEPDRYTERGKHMDGWETRRRRSPERPDPLRPDPAHDWCVLRLGIPGIVHAVDIDTSHFLGNHPPWAAVDGCELASGAVENALSEDAWREIVPHSALRPGSHNLFTVRDAGRHTHLRLRIYPDGGVARLRVYGEAAPDWGYLLASGAAPDLAALAHGGRAVACSDMFFSSIDHLLLPGRPRRMDDGWETRRRRGAGHDWVIVRLGARGRIVRVEVDTGAFKGNYPDRCSLEACRELPVGGGEAEEWHEVLASTRLGADAEHVFGEEAFAPGFADVGPVAAVRLNIYPDGGVGRLRIFGEVEP